MKIPEFQKFLISLLKKVEDGEEKSMSDVMVALAKDFNLSEEDQKEMLPSGTQSIFKNRVGWAKTYLKKATLVDSPKRGAIRITEQGKKVLSEDLSEITIKYLRKFPEFVNFQSVNNKKKSGSMGDLSNETPSEKIESAYNELRIDLKKEILGIIMKCSPFFFEKVVVNLLIKLGYGGSSKEAGTAFSTSKDGGIDGVIKEDKLGLDFVYIQAKRWKEDSCVGSPEIQKFAGALQGKRARKGVFITTSCFSKGAKEYVKKIDSNIILLDGNDFTEYMIDSNTGVSPISMYEIKKINFDYFNED